MLVAPDCYRRPFRPARWRRARCGHRVDRGDDDILRFPVRLPELECQTLRAVLSSNGTSGSILRGTTRISKFLGTGRLPLTNDRNGSLAMVSVATNPWM